MKNRMTRIIAMGMAVGFITTSVSVAEPLSVRAVEIVETEEQGLVSEENNNATDEATDTEQDEMLTDIGQEESSTDCESEEVSSDEAVSETTAEEKTADTELPDTSDAPLDEGEPSDQNQEYKADVKDEHPDSIESGSMEYIEEPNESAGITETEEEQSSEEAAYDGEWKLLEAPVQDEESFVRGGYYGHTEPVAAVADRSGRLDARPLTKIEMANLYQNAKNSSTKTSYDIQPHVSAPYAVGQVSASNRQSALKELNMYRWIAGLTPVEEAEELTDNAQYGAVLLAAVNQLTHTPSKPADMDADFYQKGYSATSSSNIVQGGVGYHRLEDGVDSCMRDNSGTNLNSVGHRRWFLNPGMRYIGFGQAQTGSNLYCTYKVFDNRNDKLDYNFVSWPPSGNFPTELVSSKLPWSISLNMDRYEVPDMREVVVEITNPQGDTEAFSMVDNNADTTYGSEKYFNVNTGGYGSGPCIICNFGSNYTSYTQPGTYQIRVRGLHSAATGDSVRIEYETTMFRASDYAGKTGVTDDQYEVIGQFVERLYTKCLGRDSEARGKLDWTMKLADRDMSGADVGNGFVFSNEYMNKKTDDSAFLDMMYDVYLGRAADAEGKEYWSDMLSHGVSRRFVFRGFAESEEYDKICRDYGIERGTVTLTEGRDLNAGATRFVYRLYDVALGREAELDGLNDWSGSIARGEKSAQTVAQSFFHSEEFTNKRFDDRAYIQVLYLTFMGREYDETGLKYWLDHLSAGRSRDEILAGFSGSQEFHDIMASYGLN